MVVKHVYPLINLFINNYRLTPHYILIGLDALICIKQITEDNRTIITYQLVVICCEAYFNLLRFWK